MLLRPLALLLACAVLPSGVADDAEYDAGIKAKHDAYMINAASLGYTGDVAAKLAAGGSADAQAKDGATALMHAALGGGTRRRRWRCWRAGQMWTPRRRPAPQR